MTSTFLAPDKRPYLSAQNAAVSKEARPKALGVIALSAPCEPARFAKGVSYLESQGLQVQVALSPSAAYGKSDFLFSSDTPQQRADALLRFARDPSIGAILAARGAYGAMEILPLLDFDTLKKFPKPLIGFSDTTALLIALHDRAGWPAVHGPSLESAFSKADGSAEHSASAAALIALLCEGKIPFEGASLSLLDARLVDAVPGAVAPKKINGKIHGAFSGGNLSLLASLVGTPYQPSFSGKILFLEDVSVKPYVIHRMLLQMKLAGVLDGISGVVLGDFSGCVHAQGLGPDLDGVLLNIFGPLGVPVFRALAAGHVPLNLPLPFGVPACIEHKAEVGGAGQLDIGMAKITFS